MQDLGIVESDFMDNFENQKKAARSSLASFYASTGVDYDSIPDSVKGEFCLLKIDYQEKMNLVWGNLYNVDIDISEQAKEAQEKLQSSIGTYDEILPTDNHSIEYALDESLKIEMNRMEDEAKQVEMDREKKLEEIKTAKRLLAECLGVKSFQINRVTDDIGAWYRDRYEVRNNNSIDAYVVLPVEIWQKRFSGIRPNMWYRLQGYCVHKVVHSRSNDFKNRMDN